jgi:hypothetical protein
MSWNARQGPGKQAEDDRHPRMGRACFADALALPTPGSTGYF